MTQVVFGAALGFMLGETVLYSLKHLLGWLRHEGVRSRIRKLPPLRGSVLVAGFIQYAGVIAACAAVVILGLWTVQELLASRSPSSTATSNLFEPLTPTPLPTPHQPADPLAGLNPQTNSATVRVGPIDPYSDTDFMVRRRPHAAGSHLSLKENLVQRSETRARADLLRQVQQHVQRSQYDCEAAERAGKYLKADLDVWGFAAWQVKYFPIQSYVGATLPQCKDIESVVDPSNRFAANHRG